MCLSLFEGTFSFVGSQASQQETPPHVLPSSILFQGEPRKDGLQKTRRFSHQWHSLGTVRHLQAMDLCLESGLRGVLVPELRQGPTTRGIRVGGVWLGLG